jgi:hypothetical protein
MKSYTGGWGKVNRFHPFNIIIRSIYRIHNYRRPNAIIISYIAVGVWGSTASAVGYNIRCPGGVPEEE